VCKDIDLERIREALSTMREVGILSVGYFMFGFPGETDGDRRQTIRLALELDLPLNVHSRSAGKHVIPMLLEYGALRVQLHAFDGKASTAEPAAKAGYFFSIPASIVRSRQKQKLVRRLPLSCLLLETDSPVLAPVAGKRNEPANLKLALNAVAEIKEIPAAEVAEAVTENFERLYG
jgi:TatD DNase family protein